MLVAARVSHGSHTDDFSEPVVQVRCRPYSKQSSVVLVVIGRKLVLISWAWNIPIRLGKATVVDKRDRRYFCFQRH